ncbi:MAG: methyl-accepting chemotaxis protein [Gammaproteobacteria bacterium]|nr:MAG: methyl-accepting chemotaxis protein [Gammaproteobacteria bacterium]RLA23160.1 MAG: methyl-accepting chemotaxis protein [Gammaproteobacteria bacterium]
MTINRSSSSQALLLLVITALTTGLLSGAIIGAAGDALVTGIASGLATGLLSSLILLFLLIRPLEKSANTIIETLESCEIKDTDNSNKLFGPIQAATTKSIRDFHDTARSLAQNGNTVAIGSAEVSFFVDTLKKAVNDQASHASQIASAAEEIAQTTSQIAGNAQLSADAATATRNESEEGQNSIEEAIQRIHSVSASVQETSASLATLQNKSDQIQNITQVINTVAEQTNLLALNAAIEAARAGEHGRGFAVVADEVRELANKTATATSEIGSMLNEIQAETSNAASVMEGLVGNVNDVVKTTEQVGSSLQSIGQQATESESQAQEIVQAIAEHVTATEEISNGIEVIHNKLQETEGETQHASDQANYLASMAEQIYGSLSHLNLGTIHDELQTAAIKMAGDVGKMFEEAIRRNEITEQQLFDQNYQPTTGTDPQKYTTQYDSFADRSLPAIQEPMLTQNSALAYAIATDTNGYVPTHNNCFSKPLTGDYQTDLAGSRSKRLFQDPTGSRCGAHTEKFLLQTYKRDTGEIFHDLSAPVYVKGKHWGGIRLGYRADS